MTTSKTPDFQSGVVCSKVQMGTVRRPSYTQGPGMILVVIGVMAGMAGSASETFRPCRLK